MWRDPQLPAHLGALLDDEILDQFTVWGEPEECARRLVALARETPGATGFRVKLPLPVESRTLAEYLEDVDALGATIASYRAAREVAPTAARR
jgi:hypothetical protein